MVNFLGFITIGAINPCPPPALFQRKSVPSELVAGNSFVCFFSFGRGADKVRCREGDNEVEMA